MRDEQMREIDKLTASEIVKDQVIFRQVFDEIFRWEEQDKEHAQSRSNFQIEKFIALDNFTISSAFHSLLKNRRVLAEGLFHKVTEMKEAQREFDHKWKDKPKDQPIEWMGKKLCWYDIDSMRFENYMRSAELELRDRVQQMRFFDGLLDKLIETNGGPITKEQFEEEESVYWERRLANQTYDEILSRHTGVSPGNIHSMRRAAAPTIVDDRNRVKDPMDVTKMLESPEGLDRFIADLRSSVALGIDDLTEKRLQIDRP